MTAGPYARSAATAILTSNTCATGTGYGCRPPMFNSVELGYATTVHGAQGLSVDTMYGLATGEESRQQLYTMLTRGRIANHLYLQVVEDGDPHSILWPRTVRPVHGDRPSRADPGA